MSEQNAKRIATGFSACAACKGLNRLKDDVQSAVIDTLANVLHFAVSESLDIEAIVRMAVVHLKAELNGEDEATPSLPKCPHCHSEDVVLQELEWVSYGKVELVDGKLVASGSCRKVLDDSGHGLCLFCNNCQKQSEAPEVEWK